jgi:hypothetical protein
VATSRPPSPGSSTDQDLGDAARDRTESAAIRPAPEAKVAGVEAPAEEAADQSRATGTDARGGEREYVVEADLGYAFLSLDYIVSRSEDPFAEINGTEVHEGSWIEGFTVEKIEQDRVLLRDDRGPLVLRVR